jgi:DNA-3-methyladenine glycosylase
MTDPFVLLAGDAVEVAPRLLGCLLVRELEDGTRISGRIVETEAYHQSDAASHSYKGKTPRTEIMFGPPGFVYVYFTYGMHYCVNVVTGPEGEGSAVLIRAIEPVEGIERMRANRGGLETTQLTNGPAKLCQALQIDKQLNGHDLHTLPLQLRVQPPIDASEIVTTTRIGITKDAHRPWRFYVAGNPFVSKL